MAISVILHRLQNANAPQRDILERSRAQLQRAVNHPDFKQRILDAPYRESRFRDRRGRITDKSPEEVAAIILGGLERGTGEDMEIDLAIKLANISYPMVGSTVPGRLPFRTAYWFVDGCVRANDTVSPARHMIHEWLHVAGFVHVHRDGVRDDVPYLVGDIVRQLLSGQRGLVAGGWEDATMARELDNATEEILLPPDEAADDETEPGED